MTRCYVVPGLAGSELYTDVALTAKTWVSYTQLALGYVGRLRLAADGISPGPPDGVQLYPGAPLPDYYAAATAQLAADLAPSGYTVVPYGYDWRLSCQTTGTALANRIRADVDASDPCSIVGHSLGGLVARLAWRSLVGTGESGLVRRIVTLGTPHYGSYGAVRIWSLDSEVSTQLSYLSLASIAVYGGLVAELNGRVWSPSRVAALASTWPSLYETMPSLLAPDVASDPNRAALYGTGWPADRGVSQAWLQYAARRVATLAGGDGLDAAFLGANDRGRQWLSNDPAALVPADPRRSGRVQRRQQRRRPGSPVLGVAGQFGADHANRHTRRLAGDHGRFQKRGASDFGGQDAAQSAAAAADHRGCESVASPRSAVAGCHRRAARPLILQVFFACRGCPRHAKR